MSKTRALIDEYCKRETMVFLLCKNKHFFVEYDDFMASPKATRSIRLQGGDILIGADICSALRNEALMVDYIQESGSLVITLSKAT